jgi:hypothetical protein
MLKRRSVQLGTCCCYPWGFVMVFLTGNKYWYFW